MTTIAENWKPSHPLQRPCAEHVEVLNFLEKYSCYGISSAVTGGMHEAHVHVFTYSS